MRWKAICIAEQPDGKNPSKSGFKSKKDAWKYIRDTYLCNTCKKYYPVTEKSCCAAEWIVKKEKNEPPIKRGVN